MNHTRQDLSTDSICKTVQGRSKNCALISQYNLTGHTIVFFPQEQPQVSDRLYDIYRDISVDYGTLGSIN